MVAIITDSSSNISQKRAQELGVTVIPLTIIFGTKEYKDDVDIDSVEFFKKLTTDKEFPHTAQLSEEQITSAVEAALKQADEVIIMPISAALSGTHERCVHIAERYENVYVYNTTCTTVWLEMLVLKAVANREKSAKEIFKILDEYRPRLRLYGVIDTLEYLGKGGRMPKAVATIGNILKIKPVISVNLKGEVVVVSKQFGMNKGFSYIDEMVKKDEIDYDEPIYLMHAMDEENSSKLIEKLGLPYKEKRELCMVIAAHIGPHGAGYAYVAKAK